MQPTRFVLTPFYEIVDTMVPLRRLKINESLHDENNQRFMGHQMIEFSVQYNHSLLLSESKRQKLSSFNIRSIIRFGKTNEMLCDEHGIIVKDAMPLHLYIDLNNTIISLPNLLPNDRHGKDGRRFPRPIDLSEGLIDNPIIINRVDIKWVQDDLKNEDYFYAIYLVRLRSCDELTSVLLNKHVSALATTLNLIQFQCLNLNGAVDEDLMLVNTSINTSLNCPVSRGRIDLPIRGRDCNHLQSFDCMTYLIMNFKKPTWKCPVCDKTTFFCYLEVDGLIFNILKDERSKLVENILFNKSGQWKPEKKIPGCQNDDQPYYDITEYPKLNQQSVGIKPNPIQVLNENLKDCQIEKYIQLIINNTKSNMSSDPVPKMPNMKTSVPPNTATVNPTTMAKEPTHQLSHPQLSYSPHLKEQMLKSGNSLFNLPNTSSNSNKHEDLYLQSKLIQTPNSISSQSQKACNDPAAMPQYRPPPPPQYHYDYPSPSYFAAMRMSANQTPDEKLSQFQITNVTSMAKGPRNVKDVIVISDDEGEDNDTFKRVIKSPRKSQKRPTMVSSVPTEVGSCKQRKLVDGHSHLSSRPHSASTYGLTTVSNVQSQLCKCTPGRTCPIHSEQDACIQRIIRNIHPTASVANESNQMNLSMNPGLSPQIYESTGKHHTVQSPQSNAPHHLIPPRHTISHSSTDYGFEQASNNDSFELIGLHADSNSAQSILLQDNIFKILEQSIQSSGGGNGTRRPSELFQASSVANGTSTQPYQIDYSSIDHIRQQSSVRHGGIANQNTMLDPSHLIPRPPALRSDNRGGSLSQNTAPNPPTQSPMRHGDGRGILAQSPMPKMPQPIGSGCTPPNILEQLEALSGARNGLVGQHSMMPKASVSHMPPVRRSGIAEQNRAVPRGSGANILNAASATIDACSGLAGYSAMPNANFSCVPGQSMVPNAAVLPQRPPMHEGLGRNPYSPSTSSDPNKRFAGRCLPNTGPRQFNSLPERPVPVYRPQPHAVYQSSMATVPSQVPGAASTAGTSRSHQAELWRMMGACPAQFQGTEALYSKMAAEHIPPQVLHPFSTHNFALPNNPNVFYSG